MSTATPLDIVESQFPPGLSVIEASAGTGKTYAISHLVPRFLLDGTVKNIGEVLLVTFTRDAARELSERVRRVLEALASEPRPGEEDSDEGLHTLRRGFPSQSHRQTIGQALIDLDNLKVSTIHSFCQRTLQNEGTLCGIPVEPEVITNADAFIDQAMYDLWQEKVCADPLLALLASEGHWNFHQDLRFVTSAFALEDYDAVPEPPHFEQTLARIRNSPAELTPAIRKELSDLVRTVPAWNNSGGDETIRSAHLKALADATVFTDPGFRGALQWVAGLGSHITARGAGRASKANAVALQAVTLANEIIHRLQTLRWAWQNECLRTARDTVRAALHADRQITQDGLISRLRDALRSDKKHELADRLRERYKVALIDESQDTDAKQFEIFKNIFVGFDAEPDIAGHRLVMIGDPKQAIYGFRGADVNTYLRARSKARKVFTLATTYRSPQPLVEAVNTVFLRQGSLLKTGLVFTPARSGKKEDRQLCLDGEPCRGRIEAWIVPDTNEDYQTSAGRTDLIAKTVASEIVRLLDSGTLGAGLESVSKVEPGHIAVLTNSNDEAVTMAAALKQRNVPAIIASGEDIMGTEEAVELLCILRAVNEPRRSGPRYAALATRLLGYDLAAIHSIQSGTKEDEVLRKFQQWQSEWERKGLAAAIALMDMEERVTPRVAVMDFGERRLTNFRQLIDLLQTASRDHSSRPEHLLRWFAQEISRAAGREAPEERQVQLESDRAAVQVVTMHKAKGLEYELVFTPFLWCSRDPEGIQRLGGTRDHAKDRLVDIALINDPTVRTEIRRSALEDRLRLAYVAMTRARSRLWIYGGELTNSKRPASASALDWLLRDAAVNGESLEQFGAWAESVKSPGRGSRHASALQNLFREDKAELLLQREPPPVSSQVWHPHAAAEVEPLAALPPPQIEPGWSVTSFSSLTRESNPRGVKEPLPPPPVINRTQTTRPSQSTELNPFAAAPGGMMLGTAIHEWLQKWDCTAPDPQAIKNHLRKFHLSPAHYLSTPPLDAAVTAMLSDLRLASLPGLGCSVAEACPTYETSEWHFHLPLKDALTPQKLAAIFARHGGAGYQRYAPMLELLPASDLHGFLQGFMDRLAFHEGSWGVIDWKTNRLGEEDHHYSPRALLDCAMESHYLLQAHFYLVALRRYLGTRPNARLAGAWLIFLRAVRAGSSAGILQINPGDDLLAALDELFFQGDQ
jgi:exodeoxyribonuclease V beta subunit